MAADPPFALPFALLEPRVAPVPVVAHVPHAATWIPGPERARLLLDDAVLAAELLRMTDAHVDRLADGLRDLGIRLLVNRVSRLVVDPERFPDDGREPMAAVGQGAVYTRTADGMPLRPADPVDRERLMARWFRPYHAALEALVATALEASGRCLVLDLHSFASRPLPSEPDQDPDRPDVCLGTDPFHTPAALVEALADAFRAQGATVAVDRPFAGTLVPLRWHRRDPRITSVMLEIRRGTYMDEATGLPNAGFDAVGRWLREAALATLRSHG